VGALGWNDGGTGGPGGIGWRGGLCVIAGKPF
jgi:hypothetical protein